MSQKVTLTLKSDFEKFIACSFMEHGRAFGHDLITQRLFRFKENPNVVYMLIKFFYT